MKTDVEWFIDYIEEATQHNYSRQLRELDIRRKLEEIETDLRSRIREDILEEIKSKASWVLDELD